MFKVELYETHIAAFNEYTEYHINFDDTSKYYTLVISGIQFLIVSYLGWCNIYQVFDSVVEELDKDPLFKEIGNGYGIPLTEEQGAKELDWIKSFVGRYE